MVPLHTLNYQTKSSKTCKRYTTCCEQQGVEPVIILLHHLRIANKNPANTRAVSSVVKKMNVFVRLFVWYHLCELMANKKLTKKYRFPYSPLIMYIYIYFVYLCNMYHMLFCVLFGQTKNGLNAVLSLNHRSNLCVIFVLFCLKYHAI